MNSFFGLEVIGSELRQSLADGICFGGRLTGQTSASQWNGLVSTERQQVIAVGIGFRKIPSRTVRRTWIFRIKRIV